MKEFSKQVGNTVGKGEIILQIGRKHCGKRRNCFLRAISPFPTVFSEDLYCTHIKTKACLGKGYAPLHRTHIVCLQGTNGIVGASREGTIPCSKSFRGNQ